MPVYPGAQISPLHSKSPIAGEQTAQASEIAFYEKVIKVKADVAAYLD